MLFNMSDRKFAGGIGILQEFRLASVKSKILHTSLLSVTEWNVCKDLLYLENCYDLCFNVVNNKYRHTSYFVNLSLFSKMKLWFCLFCLTSYPFIQAQSSVPNIIFILADDLGKKFSFQDRSYSIQIFKRILQSLLL